MAASQKGEKPHHPPCTCPTCGSYTTFSFVGEQHWPEAVARKLGVTSLILWECLSCGSSVDGAHLATDTRQTG